METSPGRSSIFIQNAILMRFEPFPLNPKATASLSISISIPIFLFLSRQVVYEKN